VAIVGKCISRVRMKLDVRFNDARESSTRRSKSARSSRGERAIRDIAISAMARSFSFVSGRFSRVGSFVGLSLRQLCMRIQRSSRRLFGIEYVPNSDSIMGGTYCENVASIGAVPE